MTIRTHPPSGPTARLAMLASSAGGSGSFLVEADDGNRYWCKSVNNLQGPKVPVTEQIVGRLGGMLDIATCRVETVLIPPDLAGWEFRPGAALAEGWVHGSAAEEPVTETHNLDHRAHDDNARRHAGYFALWDWLFGSDPQWLIKQPADWMYFSHDHGHYLPGSPDWSIAQLTTEQDTPHPLSSDPSGLDAVAVGEFADGLEALTRPELAAALSRLPLDWPVTEDELEAVVDFADRRRLPTAGRLRTLLGP
jgi:hypothetical protein